MANPDPPPSGTAPPGTRRRRRGGGRSRRPPGAPPAENAPAAPVAPDARPAPAAERRTPALVELSGYVLDLPDGRTVFREAARPSYALRSVPGSDALIPPPFLLTKGLRPGDQARVLIEERRGRSQVAEVLEV